MSIFSETLEITQILKNSIIQILNLKYKEISKQPFFKHCRKALL